MRTQKHTHEPHAYKHSCTQEYSLLYFPMTRQGSGNTQDGVGGGAGGLVFGHQQQQGMLVIFLQPVIHLPTPIMVQCIHARSYVRIVNEQADRQTNTSIKTKADNMLSKFIKCLAIVLC